jgi:hypothetical protein
VEKIKVEVGQVWVEFDPSSGERLCVATVERITTTNFAQLRYGDGSVGGILLKDGSLGPFWSCVGYSDGRPVKVREVLSQPLADSFKAVGEAMRTKEGLAICFQRVAEEVIALRPSDLQEPGWTAVVLADIEAGPKLGAESCVLNDLSPVELATNLASMVRGKCKEFRYGELVESEYAAVYREAMKRNTPPQGPWLGRRSRR